MLLEDLRKEAVEIGMKLFNERLVTLSMGNMSVRDPQTGHFVIKPRSIEYQELRPEDMVILDLEGNVVEGDLKPSSEWPMHLVVYQKRPDVNGIVHTHSPYATSFAVVGKDIPVLNGEGASLGGTVQCARYEAGGTRALGEAALEKMASTDAVLLRNHGVLAVGPALKLAFFAASFVENTAKLFILGSTIGTPVALPDEMVRDVRDEFQNKYFQSK